jgi:hypothetical protein
MTTVSTACAANPESSRFVPFVRVTAEGVPRLGVVKVGLVASTTLPEPVVASETSWLLEFEPSTDALVGTVAPFTWLALTTPVPAAESTPELEIVTPFAVPFA